MPFVKKIYRPEEENITYIHIRVPLEMMQKTTHDFIQKTLMKKIEVLNLQKYNAQNVLNDNYEINVHMNHRDVCLKEITRDFILNHWPEIQAELKDMGLYYDAFLEEDIEVGYATIVSNSVVYAHFILCDYGLEEKSTHGN